MPSVALPVTAHPPPPAGPPKAIPQPPCAPPSVLGPPPSSGPLPAGPPRSSRSSPSSTRAPAYAPDHIPTDNWNDLPTDFLSPSSRTSRSVSPRPGPTGASTPGSAEDFLTTLDKLFNGGTLSEKEKKAYYERIVKSASGIEDRLKAEVEGVACEVIDGKIEVPEGRERIVALMKRETGVAAWIPAVRRGVESWKAAA